MPLASSGTISRYQTKIKSSPAGQTQVIFYYTPVVSFDNKQIILNSGGWWTMSTKKRMNQVSEFYGLGFRVFQKAGDWFVDYKNAVQPFDSRQISLAR